ncbi:MAG TPA: surface-adhesin E family protein [Longimicrobiaceae bacterium]|jgi:hypothetical protein|nr:surface-adhesin E family protein [Longimicrobiaceae bacterium]
MSSATERVTVFATLSLILLLGASRAAAAQSAPNAELALDRRGDWAPVESIEFGTLDLDTTQVVSLGDGVYQVRTRWSFARPQRDPGGESYGTSIALRAVDCHGQRMAVLAFAELQGEHTVSSVDRPLFAATWESVDEDSAAGRLVHETCRLSARRVRIAERSPGGR